MKWLCVETHTHTVHSDARWTTKELFAAAERAGLDAMALTDHNTTTGFSEVTPETRPEIIPGIEWTTFFGHVVIIAPEKFVEWRDLTKENLDEHLRKVHEANGVAIMAHPYEEGEPFCCGCHWDFEVPDYNQIDAIEIWSGRNPDFKLMNRKAYREWLRRLGQGYRITGVTARDWHWDEPDRSLIYGVNYMKVDENLSVSDGVKDAILHGRSYISMGPQVNFTAVQNGVEAECGDTIHAGETEFKLSATDDARKELWEEYVVPEKYTIINNDKSIEVPFEGYGREVTAKMVLEPGFVYMVMHGKTHGKDSKVAVMNPIYID